MLFKRRIEIGRVEAPKASECGWFVRNYVDGTETVAEFATKYETQRHAASLCDTAVHMQLFSSDNDK